MTYPGMAFVFVVGVGLATILYYMFADNSHNQHNHSNNGTGPPPDIPQNSWSAPTARYLKIEIFYKYFCVAFIYLYLCFIDIYLFRQRSRRKGSSASTDKINCTICLAEISLPQIVNVQPCGHAFHRKCIQDWQKQGQTVQIYFKFTDLL